MIALTVLMFWRGKDMKNCFTIKTHTHQFYFNSENFRNKLFFIYFRQKMVNIHLTAVRPITKRIMVN